MTVVLTGWGILDAKTLGESDAIWLEQSLVEAASLFND